MFDVSFFFVVMMRIEAAGEGMRANSKLPCCKNACNVMFHQLRCGWTRQMVGKPNEKGCETRVDESVVQ